MNTTVLLRQPLDIGAGSKDRITFAASRWHADDAGSLHIIREGGRGTVASFAAGSWDVVVDDGSIVAVAR